MKARSPGFYSIQAAAFFAGLWLAVPASAQVQTAALTAETAALSEPASPVRGPVLGYVFDARTRLLRPIFGVPGAAYFSAALNLGFEVKELAVSPRQDSALAVEAETGRTLLIRLAGSLAQAEEIVGAMPGADRIIFSPSGESAALYFRGARQVQFLRGLRAAPESGETIDLSLPGVLTAVAVADDGETLLAASSSRDGGEVRAFSADGSSRPVTTIGRTSSMSFFHGSADAVVADMDRSEVILARDVSGSAETSVIASALDGVVRPVAVAVSSDNGRVFAASLETGSVATIPSAGGPVVALTDCSCAPRTLAPLAGDSIFRLSDDPRSAIRVLDARSARSIASGAAAAPRVLFIPAVADEAVAAASVPQAARGRR